MVKYYYCKKCRRIIPIKSKLKLVRCPFLDCCYRFKNPFTTIKNNN